MESGDGNRMVSKFLGLALDSIKQGKKNDKNEK